MWHLGNRDIVVLVSVISGWAILLNIFGPYLASTITFVVVVCGWLTYIVTDDTPFTPHALLILDYVEQALREFIRFLKSGYQQFVVYITVLIRSICHLYRVNIVERMAQHRRSTYQLSSETRASSRNTSRFSLVEGLSPIPRGTFRQVGNSSNAENTPYPNSERRTLERASSLEHVTSTPLTSWRKEDARNGDVFTANHNTGNRNTWRGTQSFSQTHTLSRGEESTYSPEGSPWGTSISPKMRARAAGVKTVQTVAGPLLASTRYNIDPKVYSDVTSPGLTTRLTRYATEANTKLTHQSQYRTGQFPRVNLNTSPMPLINAKTGKLRSPVTVRIAPPENTRYSPPERQQILSEICHVESKAQPSVVQVLREISLKRHASREDVTFELAKKQRTDGVFSDGLENLEEMTQKRARDDSSRSEEDVSPPNKSLRPAKRSKMPSCHDILSSLSSSISVSSGVKRKAIDVSRSGTPDVGKHFKSLDSSHGDGIHPSLLSRSISEPAKSMKRLLNDAETGHSDRQRPNKKSLEAIPQKGIVKPSLPGKGSLNTARADSMQTEPEIVQREVKATSERSISRPAPSPVRLTDKLFMKAEPENIEKIKTLIEEQDSATPRFTTDSADEIKKSDIVNMRQTSMKNRLKSMFDAISGKATSKIDPEVVIQAEDKSTASQAIVVSLSSSTSTTNVNTSPIATSAIVPIIGKSKTATSPTKHVTFQFANDSSTKSTTVEFPKFTTSETKTSDTIQETKKLDNPVVAEKTTSINLTFTCTNPTTSFTPLSIGSSIFTHASTSPSQQSLPLAPTELTKSSVSTNSPLGGVTTTASQLNAQITNTTASTSLFGIPPAHMAKPVSTLPSFSMQANERPQPAASFAFGTPKSTTVTASSRGALLATPQVPMTSPHQVVSSSGSSFSAPTTSSGMFSFGLATKPGQSESSATLTPEGLKNTEKKAFTFGATVPSSLGFQPSGTTTASQNSSTSSAAATTSTGSGFNLSTTTAPATIFGTPNTSTTAMSTGFSSTASTSSGFTFGTSTTAAGTSKPGFSFGTTPAISPVPATTSSGVPSSSFGVTSSNMAIPVFGGLVTTSASSTTQPSIFGAPATTSSSMTTQPSLFGAPPTTTTQPTIFGAPAASSSGFSGNATASVFGTSGIQSKAFPATSSAPTAFGTPKTSETPTLASSTVAAPSFATTTKSSSGIFSGVSSEANATAALPSFGNSAFSQKPVTAFGANTATSSFSASTANPPSLFESQPIEAFGSAPSCNAGTTPIYGFSSTPAPSFGAPSTGPSAFGATNTSTTSFGVTTTAAPTFGSLSTTTPNFGTSNSGVPTIGHQNVTSPNFSAPSATFGATTTAPPAFPTPSSSGFGGSSTSTAFGANTNPPPAFSTATSFTRFGAPPNTSSPFGATPTPANTTFGATSTGNTSFGPNTNNNNTNTNFTFGASQPNIQQPQPNAVFTFGGAPTTQVNNATSGPAPFQFSAAAPQTGGFNFTGAPTTPALNFSKDGAPGGSFALPTPGVSSFSVPPVPGGMFSIGTGSTAPRSRPSRRRQR